MNTEAKFEDLLGKTLVSIVGAVGDDTLTFSATDGSEYALYHYQDCCESVTLNDIIGDVKNLFDSPLLQAELVSFDNAPNPILDYTPDSFIWSFYKLATIKGAVVFRWLGESNGYYSETVDFRKIK